MNKIWNKSSCCCMAAHQKDVSEKVSSRWCRGRLELFIIHTHYSVISIWWPLAPPMGTSNQHTESLTLTRKTSLSRCGLDCTTAQLQIVQFLHISSWRLDRCFCLPKKILVHSLCSFGSVIVATSHEIHQTTRTVFPFYQLIDAHTPYDESWFIKEPKKHASLNKTNRIWFKFSF